MCVAGLPSSTASTVIFGHIQFQEFRHDDVLSSLCRTSVQMGSSVRSGCVFLHLAGSPCHGSSSCEIAAGSFTFLTVELRILKLKILPSAGARVLKDHFWLLLVRKNTRKRYSGSGNCSKSTSRR